MSFTLTKEQQNGWRTDSEIEYIDLTENDHVQAIEIDIKDEKKKKKITLTCVASFM